MGYKYGLIHLKEFVFWALHIQPVNITNWKG